MLTIKKANYDSYGAYGQYYKFSKNRGIKTIGYNEYENIEQAKKSFAYEDALKEAMLYREAYKTGLVPKCYGVTIVNVKNSFKPAIILQHVGEITLNLQKDMLNAHRDDAEYIADQLAERLNRYGIIHNDLNFNNIMWHNERYYCLDFTPDHIFSQSLGGNGLDIPKDILSSVPTSKSRAVKELSKWQKIRRFFKRLS